MKILYFDCFSGISGDMTIGALIDAGGDPVALERELKKLQMEDEYKLKFSKVIKNGITSTKFDVVLNEHSHEDHSHSHESHEHAHEDHSHSHESHEHAHEGHSHSHESHEHANEGHSHSHEPHEHANEGHSHSHEPHEHAHEDHSHSHEPHEHVHDDHHHSHRSYKHIVEMIRQAQFSERVEDMSLQIFKKIGIAEGKIHGVALEDVHFHEVGAVDSIIDIIGVAILIDQLSPDVIHSSPIPVGSGKIHIDHGIYPVPAPATLEILKGVPIAASDVKGELATPTGAAIVAALAETFGTLPTMTVEKIGYGAGTKTFATHPNIVRVVIGESL